MRFLRHTKSRKTIRENMPRLDLHIYAYLDHIRVLGNSQTFHHKASRIFTSSAGDYQVFRAHLLSLGSRDVSV